MTQARTPTKGKKKKLSLIVDLEVQHEDTVIKHI
jgi:hypothetical protein